MGDRFLHNLDWLILLPVLLLIGFGLLTLYSIGHVPDDLGRTFQSGESSFFHRQVIWFLIGIGVLIFATIVPFRYYESLAVLLYLAGVGLLIVVLVLEPSQKASRWIVLGGFRFQPSEFMKVAVIFLLARVLAEKRNDPNKLRVLALSFLIVTIPFLLVVKQPDLGTSLVFPALLFTILYWRGLNENILVLFITPLISAFLTIYSERTLGRGTYPYPLLIFLLVILILAYRRRRDIVQGVLLVGLNLGVMLIVPNLWNRLQLYQQKRILAFLRPESDILGTGWQVYQSKVAIGSGGFIGKGYLHGTQKLLAFLPEKHSDFIYSVLSEELGYIGAVVVLLLFAVMIVRGLYLAINVKNRFASIAAVGVCAYFAFHVIVNIGMTIGLAPVTGLPLPFLSHGGSSMVISCFMAGTLLNFSARFYEY
ncbi:MAG: rod shape-determining protein RodA [bacterium]|nr:MAG: rod shape-determining protein RodA [bacterium]